MGTHTPWELGDRSQIGGQSKRWIVVGDRVVGDIFADEDAAHIVKCVNGWDEQQAKIDELVQALGVAKQALTMLGSEIPKLRADVGKNPRLATPANYAAELAAIANKSIDAALTRAKGE